MTERPRFDDGEAVGREVQPMYCDKGGHFKRSVFNKSLARAERLGLEKCDLVLDETITVFEAPKPELPQK